MRKCIAPVAYAITFYPLLHDIWSDSGGTRIDADGRIILTALIVIVVCPLYALSVSSLFNRCLRAVDEGSIRLIASPSSLWGKYFLNYSPSFQLQPPYQLNNIIKILFLLMVSLFPLLLPITLWCL